jgi:hypothetical protein
MASFFSSYEFHIGFDLNQSWKPKHQQFFHTDVLIGVLMNEYEI